MRQIIPGSWVLILAVAGDMCFLKVMASDFDPSTDSEGSIDDEHESNSSGDSPQWKKITLPPKLPDTAEPRDRVVNLFNALFIAYNEVIGGWVSGSVGDAQFLDAIDKLMISNVVELIELSGDNEFLFKPNSIPKSLVGDVWKVGGNLGNLLTELKGLQEGVEKAKGVKTPNKEKTRLSHSVFLLMANLHGAAPYSFGIPIEEWEKNCVVPIDLDDDLRSSVSSSRSSIVSEFRAESPSDVSEWTESYMTNEQYRRDLEKTVADLLKQNKGMTVWLRTAKVGKLSANYLPSSATYRGVTVLKHLMANMLVCTLEIVKLKLDHTETQLSSEEVRDPFLIFLKKLVYESILPHLKLLKNRISLSIKNYPSRVLAGDEQVVSDLQLAIKTVERIMSQTDVAEALLDFYPELFIHVRSTFQHGPRLLGASAELKRGWDSEIHRFLDPFAKVEQGGDNRLSEYRSSEERTMSPIHERQ